jgi:flagellar basal-body rod protein FlgF
MDTVSSIAASRLVAQQRAMDVTAANIANANTPGFKAERMLFSDWLSPQSATGGERSIAYTQDRATWRDQRGGTLIHSGNPFDLALTGDGYFTVATPRGPRLTRDGRFGLRPDGTVADSSGNALLDNNGRPLLLSPTDTKIATTVSSENGQLARIGVVRVSDPMQITAEGNTLIRANAPTAAIVSPSLVQGAVEDSNVQPVLETTRMMNDLRQFQFMTQFIQAEADRQQSAIDKLLPQGA